MLVPDLYKGKLGVDKEEASHLMSNLDWDVAAREIAQAAAHLRAEGSPKVGATGFCMGGALTLVGAATCDDITCGACLVALWCACEHGCALRAHAARCLHSGAVLWHSARRATRLQHAEEAHSGTVWIA